MINKSEITDCSHIMQLSLIICTKDRTVEISKCLNSIIKQTYPPLEIIIVDSSCDNSTFKLINEIESKFYATKIKYLYSSPGLTLQRNIGIENISQTSDVVCFFDDDVELYADYLKIIKNFLECSDKNILGVCGNIVNEKKRSILSRLIRSIFFITTNNSGKILASGDAGHIFSPLDNTEVAVLSGCNMCFRKEIFSCNNFRFDEKLRTYAYMEDQDFSMRVSNRGKLMQLSNAYLFHNESPVNRLQYEKLFEMYITNSNYLWYKNISFLGYPRLAYWWRIVGKFLHAIFIIIFFLSFKPIYGFVNGLLHRNLLR